MIQDNQLFEDINSLPPEKKAEVIDFVGRLKEKESSPSELSEKLALAEKLLFGTPDDMDEEEIALWDAVIESLDEDPVRFNEPDLSSYDS